MVGCGASLRLAGLAITSLTCFPRITCRCVKPAVSGDAFMASQGGSEKMVLRKRGKCLKRWNVGSELSIASTIGAAKSGSSIALTDLAKQNVVMVSIAKQRKANNKSDDLPFLSFFARISAR